MNTLIMGIFWCVYGILGLFGVQIIAYEYKGKSWTKKYIHCRGISWLLLGIPWIIVYIVDHYMNIDNHIWALLLAIASIPSIIYTVVYERKYKNMLKNDQQ